MAEFIIVHSVKVATDFTPETFGRLTTIGPKFRLREGAKGRGVTRQVCQCDCGQVGVYRCGDIKRTHTRSCGCLYTDVTKTRCTTHGKAYSVEYSTWCNLYRRCHNPKDREYHYYGGRGIRVCDRWREPNGQGFLNFLSDMGERPAENLSIDRYPDKDGNYEPGNCRWATDKEQCRNRRSNALWTYNGKTQCIAAWAEEVGISQFILWKRLHRGWSVEQALTRPPRPPRKRK